MAIKKVTIGIDEDVLKIIDQRAKETTRSRSNYITSAIKDFVEYETKKEKSEQELKNRIVELEKQLVNFPHQVIKAVQPEIKPETKQGFIKNISNEIEEF